MKLVKPIKILIFSSLLFNFTLVQALTKPGPDASIENLSYVFYLYYDNGQLFGDRDYEIKFDVIDKQYVPQTVNEETAYKGEIVNFKSEIAKTFFFDPKIGNPTNKTGKMLVEGPYVTDGQQVRFYNPQGQQLVTIFVVGASICNDDGTCNEGAGENDKTCSNDCKKPRATPAPAVIEETSAPLGLGFDWNSILIYVVGGAGVVFIGWLGWKMWKKHREGAFVMNSPTSPVSQLPPEPPKPEDQKFN